MGTSSRLATTLDQEMLDVRTVEIASRSTPDAAIPSKSGKVVFDELGGRFLLRYLLPSQVLDFLDGSEDRLHYATPTAYQPEETISWLALPAPTKPRTHVLILDPRKIEVIRGPRWVRLGGGIEYILPQGFTRDALALPWPIEVR